MILVRLRVGNSTCLGKIVHLRVVHLQASSRILAREVDPGDPWCWFLFFLCNSLLLFPPFGCWSSFLFRVLDLLVAVVVVVVLLGYVNTVVGISDSADATALGS